MTQENVELVSSAYAALNAGELDRVTEFVHPEAEWEVVSVAPNAGTYRGIDEVRGLIEDWLNAFDELRIEPEELLEAAPDKVVALVRDRGRIKGSDARIDHPFAHVWTVRDGKLYRWQSFFERDEAFTAAGLEAGAPRGEAS